MFIIKKKLEHHDEKRDYKMELQMNQKMEYKFQRRIITHEAEIDSQI